MAREKEIRRPGVGIVNHKTRSVHRTVSLSEGTRMARRQAPGGQKNERHATDDIQDTCCVSVFLFLQAAGQFPDPSDQ